MRAWVRTWASDGAEIITPGGKTISLDGNNLATAEYVYFIHSEEILLLVVKNLLNGYIQKYLKNLSLIRIKRHNNCLLFTDNSWENLISSCAAYI